MHADIYRFLSAFLPFTIWILVQLCTDLPKRDSYSRIMPVLLNNMVVDSVLPRFYPHRKNRDGSFDSICTMCYQTIATGSCESHLQAVEDVHMCEPLRKSRAA